MQLPGEQQHESLSSSMMRDARILITIVHIFFAIFSTTLVVFLRYRFGERYLKSWLFVFSFLLIMLGSVLGAAFAREGGYEKNVASASGALVLYAWAFLALGTWHTVQAIRRRRRGERWHSQCRVRRVRKTLAVEERQGQEEDQQGDGCYQHQGGTCQRPGRGAILGPCRPPSPAP